MQLIIVCTVDVRDDSGVDMSFSCIWYQLSLLCERRATKSVFKCYYWHRSDTGKSCIGSTTDWFTAATARP